jgi:hypothetical protein
VNTLKNVWTLRDNMCTFDPPLNVLRSSLRALLDYGGGGYSPQRYILGPGLKSSAFPFISTQKIHLPPPIAGGGPDRIQFSVPISGGFPIVSLSLMRSKVAKPSDRHSLIWPLVSTDTL